MFRIIPRRLLSEPHVAVDVSERTAGGAKATLRIEGLVCSACAANVARHVEAVDGVRSADVDLDRGEAHVNYDTARTTPDALVQAAEAAVVLRPARRLLAALSGRHVHP